MTLCELFHLSSFRLLTPRAHVVVVVVVVVTHEFHALAR